MRFSSGGGALLSAFCKKTDNSFTNNYEAPNKIAELYNGTSFNKTNLQKLFDTISGQSNIGFGALRSMANTTTTSEQMIANAGDEISVTLGDLEWTPTYLSTDNNGNPILTLWLTKNEQEAWKGDNTDGNSGDLKAAQGRFYGFYNGGLFSDWSSNWYNSATKDGDPNFYPSAMYGTSYIRAVTLNNGGQYATSNTAMSTASYTPNESSVFAKFTMPNVEGSLTKYIVKPVDVKWQEFQSTKDIGVDDYNYPNDAWSTETPNDGFYIESNEPGRYNYAEHNGYDTWKNDYIWLPSMAETGYSGGSAGLWKTSTKQRANYNGTTSSSSISGSVGGGSDVGFDGTGSSDSIYPMSWLRSGYFHNAYSAYLGASGSDYYYYFIVSNSLAVRPSLHLSLNAAAESAGIEIPPITWLDFAASKFANEDEADGVETPYEISTAEELARLAYVVNNDLSNDAGVAYNTLNYKQTADIQLGQYNWVPIGTAGSNFIGEYDGGGYNIDGMYIDGDSLPPDPSGNRLGLFATTGLFNGDECLGTSTLKNITIRSGKITSTQSAQYAGGIAGESNFSNIENCKNYADITIDSGTGYAGGMVASTVGCTIVGCVNYGNISASDAGGIINDDAWWFDDAVEEISFCTNYGNIYGRVTAGGICGSVAAHNISNCTVYGEISGVGQLGGLAANGGSNASNCSVYATIIAAGSGLVGEFFATGAEGEIKNCLFIGTIKNATPALVADKDGATFDSCYAIINGEKYYTDGDFSGWAMSDKFNSGYPVQRDMYWSMQFAPEFDKSYFDGWTKIS